MALLLPAQSLTPLGVVVSGVGSELMEDPGQRWPRLRRTSLPCELLSLRAARGSHGGSTDGHVQTGPLPLHQQLCLLWPPARARTQVATLGDVYLAIFFLFSSSHGLWLGLVFVFVFFNVTASSLFVDKGLVFTGCR